MHIPNEVIYYIKQTIKDTLYDNYKLNAEVDLETDNGVMVKVKAPYRPVGMGKSTVIKYESNAYNSYKELLKHIDDGELLKDLLRKIGGAMRDFMYD